MDNILSEKLEHYKHLGNDVTHRQKRLKWLEIRDLIRYEPKSVQMKIYREANPEKIVEQISKQRGKYIQLKKDVLGHYGNGNLACVLCGEDRLTCLTIDHIHGMGNRQRTGNLKYSKSFYKWLKNQVYPEGYQTLCMNCQFVKRAENNEWGKYASQPIDWQAEK